MDSDKECKSELRFAFFAFFGARNRTKNDQYSPKTKDRDLARKDVPRARKDRDLARKDRVLAS